MQYLLWSHRRMSGPLGPLASHKLPNRNDTCWKKKQLVKSEGKLDRLGNAKECKECTHWYVPTFLSTCMVENIKTTNALDIKKFERSPKQVVVPCQSTTMLQLCPLETVAEIWSCLILLGVSWPNQGLSSSSSLSASRPTLVLTQAFVWISLKTPININTSQASSKHQQKDRNSTSNIYIVERGRPIVKCGQLPKNLFELITYSS